MRVLILITFLLTAISMSALAEERITSYGVDVSVNRDGSLDFAETIAVIGENKNVRRGIFRYIPVVSDIEGVRVNADFEIKTVMRDGMPEPYVLERSGDRVSLRIGDPNVFIGAGTFNYTIRYRMTRQLLFYPDRDVLALSAVGTGWTFPIENVEVTVHLPPGIQVLTVRGYTGGAGESGKDYVFRNALSGDVVIATTRRLEPLEGLSIFLAWKSGIIARGSQDL